MFAKETVLGICEPLRLVLHLSICSLTDWQNRRPCSRTLVSVSDSTSWRPRGGKRMGIMSPPLSPCGLPICLD